jgi:hypothetical protein
MAYLIGISVYWGHCEYARNQRASPIRHFTQIRWFQSLRNLRNAVIGATAKPSLFLIGSNQV